VCGTNLSGSASLPTGVDVSANSGSSLPRYPVSQMSTNAQSGLASYWWRVLGFIIDYIILGALSAVGSRVAHLSFYPDLIVISVVTFFYGALTIAYWDGQTIGMKIVRIRCVNEADGNAVQLRQAYVRAAVYVVLEVIGSLVAIHTHTHPTTQQTRQEARDLVVVLALSLPHLLDLLWPIWDKENQTLHDKFAKTVVIRPTTTLL
jgi:uncharacterized RDD family membrane protein YckC